MQTIKYLQNCPEEFKTFLDAMLGSLHTKHLKHHLWDLGVQFEATGDNNIIKVKYDEDSVVYSANPAHFKTIKDLFFSSERYCEFQNSFSEKNRRSAYLYNLLILKIRIRMEICKGLGNGTIHIRSLLEVLSAMPVYMTNGENKTVGDFVVCNASGEYLLKPLEVEYLADVGSAMELIGFYLSCLLDGVNSKKEYRNCIESLMTSFIEKAIKNKFVEYIIQHMGRREYASSGYCDTEDLLCITQNELAFVISCHMVDRLTMQMRQRNSCFADASMKNLISEAFSYFPKNLVPLMEKRIDIYKKDIFENPEKIRALIAKKSSHNSYISEGDLQCWTSEYFQLVKQLLNGNYSLRLEGSQEKLFLYTPPPALND